MAKHSTGFLDTKGAVPLGTAGISTDHSKNSRPWVPQGREQNPLRHSFCCLWTRHIHSSHRRCHFEPWGECQRQKTLTGKSPQKPSLHSYLMLFILTRVQIWNTFLSLPPFCRLVLCMSGSSESQNLRKKSKRLYWLYFLYGSGLRLLSSPRNKRSLGMDFTTVLSVNTL